MSSVWGKNIKVSVFGESHGNGIGVVIDGFPAGLAYNEEEILAYMKRRAPGGRFATKRSEPDILRVLSGIFGGYTTGAPICAVIENTSQRSSDYDLTVPRPSHADLPAVLKYSGFADLRGGGHYSGRLTAPLVFAGALAVTALKNKGIHVGAHLSSVGDDDYGCFDPMKVDAELLERMKEKELPIIDTGAWERFADKIETVRKDGDSVGGIIECAVVGVPVGEGGHMFESVEGRLASILFGISGIKGVEFGRGFDISRGLGSEMNDGYSSCEDRIVPLSNNCGGIAGGMTTGAPIVFRVAMKPTPSIAKEQDSVNIHTGENVKLNIGGRHDPCIALRAVPVVECAAALAIFDILLDPPAVIE